MHSRKGFKPKKFLLRKVVAVFSATTSRKKAPTLRRSHALLPQERNPNAGRRTQKGETPSPVSLSGSGIAAGLGRNITARHRRNITAGRLCVAGPRRLRLSRRAETSVRAFMPVSWARLRQHVGHHGCRYRCPGGKDGAAGNWCKQPGTRAGGQANGRAVWAAARATGVARALASGARRARVGRQSSPAGARPALLAARVTICVVPRLERNQGGSAQRGLDGSTEATLVCPVTHHCGGSGGRRGTPLMHLQLPHHMNDADVTDVHICTGSYSTRY